MGKLHIKGHVASFPRECHPDEYPDLKLVNTVICEQVNFWLGKFKHILKHMNFFRYNFFLFIILDMYKNLKINGKVDVIDTFRIDQSHALKRSNYCVNN